MGIYLNPGNIAFRKALKSEIYIDKTGLIGLTSRRIGTADCFFCVSRPRRFGKTMAADMLAAYYSRGCDSGELFAGLQAEADSSFPEHLNRHNVIRLNLQLFLYSPEHLRLFIGALQKAVIAELRTEYGDCFQETSYGLPDALCQIYARTGEGFIFLIDEWDCVFRFAKERKDIQKGYLDFLRGLFKDQPYVELAYMTGILPIKKYGEHSALNLFDEYSMLDSAELATFFGFTEDEAFALCAQRNAGFPDIKSWYDGYLLNGMHIYNPKSVTDAVKRGRCRSYWTGTETYEALKIYIDLDFDGLREAVIGMLGGLRCRMDPSTSQNDMTSFRGRDDVLALLIHLGYLAYDEDAGEAFIPNQEIAQEFLRAVKVGGWEGLMDALSRSEALLHSTWALDGEAVAQGMEAIHSETASMLKYNSENSLSCSVLMAYYSAKAYYRNPVLEMPSGKGFADVVYLPERDSDKPALVVELKWDKSAEGAIAQIRDKGYAGWLEGYEGKILLVGISYDKESKKHTCVIEEHPA